MKKFISIILTFFLIISLVCLSSIVIVKKVVNKDTIVDIIMAIDEEEESVAYESSTALAYVDPNAIAYTEEELKNMDSNQLKSIASDPDKLHEALDSTFVKQELPEELIDYIVKDKEYQKEVAVFIEQYIAYVAGTAEKPVINQTKVNEVLNNNIDKYEKDTGKVVKRNNLEKVVSDMSDELDKTVDEIEVDETVKLGLNLLYSNKLVIAFGVVSLVFAGLIILINRNKSVFTYLGVASLLNGFLFLSARVNIDKATISDEYEEIIRTVINNLHGPLNTVWITSIVIGVILIAIRILFNVSKTEDKKEEK